MVWIYFSGDFESNVVLINGKKDSIRYVGMFHEHLLPFVDDLPLTLVFMQHGAPCHRSNEAKRWLEGNYVALLE